MELQNENKVRKYPEKDKEVEAKSSWSEHAVGSWSGFHYRSMNEGMPSMYAACVLASITPVSL